LRDDPHSIKRRPDGNLEVFVRTLDVTRLRAFFFINILLAWIKARLTIHDYLTTGRVKEILR